MDRVSDERLETMRQRMEKYYEAECAQAGGLWEYYLFLAKALRELQARRAQRCETCANHRAMLGGHGACRVLFTREGFAKAVKPNDHCWPWWQAKEAADAKVDTDSTGDVPR